MLFSRKVIANLLVMKMEVGLAITAKCLTTREENRAMASLAPKYTANEIIPCYHGGKSFEAIGSEFNQLHHRDKIINADVLDAWFPPSPRVIDALQELLPWLLRTAPPTYAEGLIRTIAQVRRVHPDSILVGGGSSALNLFGTQTLAYEQVTSIAP